MKLKQPPSKRIVKGAKGVIKQGAKMVNRTFLKPARTSISRVPRKVMRSVSTVIIGVPRATKRIGKITKNVISRVMSDPLLAAGLSPVGVVRVMNKPAKKKSSSRR